MNMPGLGDPAKVFLVNLTEPEINSLYALVAFAEAAANGPLSIPILKEWWAHYGPTVKQLEENLKEFDGQ